MCSSPRPIAAYRALPRLRVPRHPPLAFPRLTPPESNAPRTAGSLRPSTYSALAQQRRPSPARAPRIRFPLRPATKPRQPVALSSLTCQSAPRLVSRRGELRTVTGAAVAVNCRAAWASPARRVLLVAAGLHRTRFVGGRQVFVGGFRPARRVRKSGPRREGHCTPPDSGRQPRAAPRRRGRTPPQWRQRPAPGTMRP